MTDATEIEPEDLLQGHVFGHWDAPATDGDIPIDPPIGKLCMYCEEAIQEGDNGRIQPNGFIVHRECNLRAFMGGIGHHVDHQRYCIEMGDPDAGFGRRGSALMMWNLWQLTGGVLERGAEMRDSLKLLHYLRDEA